ncbi:MAG: hypothetical protein EB145_15770 [Proteobacteria bacterium]|nr:hypothetical protein [Pseudomonadota bacterium]
MARGPELLTVCRHQADARVGLTDGLPGPVRMRGRGLHGHPKQSTPINPVPDPGHDALDLNAVSPGVSEPATGHPVAISASLTLASSASGVPAYVTAGQVAGAIAGAPTTGLANRVPTQRLSGAHTQVRTSGQATFRTDCPLNLATHHPGHSCGLRQRRPGARQALTSRVLGTQQLPKRAKSPGTALNPGSHRHRD